MRIETSLECQGTTWEGHLLSMGVGSKGFLEEEIPELRLEQSWNPARAEAELIY